MKINNEEILVFKEFNSVTAYRLGKIITDKAINENIKLCTDIYVNNKCLYHFSSDQCIPDNDNWLRRKRNTVLYFNNSTKFMGNKLKEDSTLLNTKYGLEIKDYAIVAGGYPVYLENGGFIGAICVSGQAPETDHQIIEDAIKELTGGK